MILGHLHLHSPARKVVSIFLFINLNIIIHFRIIDLAGVSLQGVGATGVAGSSSTTGLSGPDKYSALAQLDVAVKEITLKDTPPSNEKLSESWGSSGSGQNVNPFGAAPAGVTQPQQNPFMAAGPGMQQQGFGQFVSAQPQAMPQQGGWAQPQGPMFNNPQQATSFGNTQYQGQAGFSGGGGFVQQPPQQQQGMFGAGGAAQFSGGFPQQQRQWQPTQQLSQQRPQQQQQQWQQQQPQQQQPVFGNASQSFGGSKSTSATSTSSTNANLQLGWSSGLAKPVAVTTASAVQSVPGSGSTGGTGWSTTLTAPAPQPTGQMNWNTPAASGNMQQQNWGGSGSSLQQQQPQPGGGWGSTGQQTMFGAVPQQQQHQNQMFGVGTAFGQPNQMSNQMYMAQQPQMFGAPQQQQMFGMPNQQPPQQSFGTWSQNSNPQQQGGFNWNNQAMPGGLQRKDSKNIIVGNWGTQPSNSQGDTTNYVPNNMNTSNPFTVSWSLIIVYINLMYHLFVGIK